MRISSSRHHSAVRAPGSARQAVRRLDAQLAERWFPESQRRRWPEGYLPAVGVAHLLRPDGVPLRDFLECYREVRTSSQRVARRESPSSHSSPSPDILRDIATDYTLWLRCRLEEYLNRLQRGGRDEEGREEESCIRQRRLFRRWTARDRVRVHDEEIRTLFDLIPYTAPAVHAACAYSASSKDCLTQGGSRTAITSQASLGCGRDDRGGGQPSVLHSGASDDHSRDTSKAPGVYGAHRVHVRHEECTPCQASRILPYAASRRGALDSHSSRFASTNSCSSRQKEVHEEDNNKDHVAPRVMRHYAHTPYAVSQAYAMRLLSPPSASNSSTLRTHALSHRIHFTTLPDLRNALYADFDSMSALRALSLYSGDDIVFSPELVQALSVYLRRRLDELCGQEDAFVAEVPEWTFARDSPILALFGNGRLAWLLNGCGGEGKEKGGEVEGWSVLPRPVYPVQTPAQARQRARQSQRLLQLKSQSLVGDASLFAAGFTMPFPCEVLSVSEALSKYRPAVVLVEPHVDRDWLSDIRGFYSVREVIVLGPVDSPAMASFSYPFLSFGVTPGPQSYWLYNDYAQCMTHAAPLCMPVDAPHVMQGYERRFVDSISAYLVSCNDCAVVPNQYRCLSFVRQRPPQRRTQPVSRKE